MTVTPWPTRSGPQLLELKAQRERLAYLLPADTRLQGNRAARKSWKTAEGLQEMITAFSFNAVKAMSIRITAMTEEQRLNFLRSQDATLLLKVHHDQDLNRFYGGSAEKSVIHPAILNTLVARQDNHQHAMYDEGQTGPYDPPTKPGATEPDGHDFQYLGGFHRWSLHLGWKGIGTENCFIRPRMVESLGFLGPLGPQPIVPVA